MPESIDLLAEVKRLRREQEDQGEVLGALLRHSRRELREELIAEFNSDPVERGILLLVDGNKAQGEILAELQAQQVAGSSPMTVSRRFRRLSEDLGLIVQSRRTAAGIVYRLTAFEKALGIVRDLQRGRR